MKRTLLFLTCVLASMMVSAQGSNADYFDYIPFVEKGKTWHVVNPSANRSYHFEQYMLTNEEVVENGKTYVKMNLNADGSFVLYDAALLREENRKVYLFIPSAQKEILVFDYSLKAGDTYEGYSLDGMEKVSYKVVSVDDYLEGPEIVRYDNNQAADRKVAQHRYLRRWTLCRTDDNSIQKTWIEGVGSLNGPLGNLYDLRYAFPGSQNYLAYVVANDDANVNSYLSFPFYDKSHQVHGCNLPTGETDHSDRYNQLTYELEGDRLHVYGKVFTNCGPNNYACFIEKPTDDPLVHKIEFVIQEVGPIATCMALHATNFYVSGFDPDMNYIMVDNQGKEHPVINKKQQGHQNITYYYYYKGDKVPLTLNENKVVVSIPKEYDDVSKRIRANLPVLNTITDQVFDSFIIPRSDFERLTSQDFWKEDAKSVVLTSSYYTEDKTEVFETPYLNVKLKKEDDADLLASYAEKYRLKIVGNDSFMPLWYILHVTPESEKSPLKCANELFESGEFASVVPDLSSDDDFDLGIAYRPFIEDGKVWKVGTIPTVSGNPVQVVDYYYFAGDTIVGGKTCKQMMCQKYVSPGFSDAAPSLTKVGAWYEEDKKVYFYDERKQSVMLKYDFTIWDNGSVQLIDDYPPFIIGPKQTGGLEGFKGVYRDVMINQDVRITTWLEGVGGIDGPTRNAYPEAADRMPEFLMSCTVGDEVIYLNDAYEDGATPEGARKDRIDFTHTIKIRPKTRMMKEAEAKSLYGEYSSQQLGINLNALDEAYLVSITDEAGKVVYEKTVNAGSIVGLNIDISAYAKGRYTVTVENSNESFTGQFETQTTGISLTPALSRREGAIYNLQGQRINSLRKGLNIVDGRKVYVK